MPTAATTLRRLFPALALEIMFRKGGLKRKITAHNGLGRRKYSRKELARTRQFTEEQRQAQSRKLSLREWQKYAAELEADNLALRGKLDKAESQKLKADKVLRTLRTLISRTSIQLWEDGCAQPRCELSRIRCFKAAVEKAAEKLAVQLRGTAVQKSVAMWIREMALKERDETTATSEGEEGAQDQYDELLLQEQLMALRRVMDQYAVSDNVVKQLFMVLKLKGISGDSLTLARHALNDVMEDTFHIHTTDDVTWVEPKELVLLALRLAGLDSAGETNPDMVVVGDGRTAGNRTTTFLALRLVRVGAAHRPAPGYKNVILPLAIVDSGEKYDVLEPLLRDLLDMMEKAQSSGFDLGEGGNCKPVWWLGGDMKWLLMITGCSTAQHACIHCHCKKEQRSAFMTVWGLDRRDTDTKEQGRLRGNLFWFVPCSRVMPDFLHLHLRIGERVIHATCDSLLTQAKVVRKDGDAEFANGAAWLAAQLGPQIEDLAKLAQRSVSFELREETWQITPKLSGNRLRPVLAKLEIAKLPFFATRKGEDGLVALALRLQKAWTDFVTLFEVVNQPNPFETDVGVDEWQRGVQGWVMGCVHGTKQQKALFPSNFVTPYVHTFMNHVPSLLLLWKDLHEFAGQEFERENNVHNLIWFRCSSRKGLAATRGIMLAALRRLANSVGDARVYLCLEIGCGSRYKSQTTLDNHTRAKHPHATPQSAPQARAKALLQARAKQALEYGAEVRALAIVHSSNRRDLLNAGRARLRAEDRAARAQIEHARSQQ